MIPPISVKAAGGLPMDEITLTIDDRTVTGRADQTILEIALENGIDIPYLCYHPRLSTSGACRICLVRVDGGKLTAACTGEVSDGMDVVTEDKEIIEYRKWVLEQLLSEGDHNCLYCDANGSCRLQALVQRYDVGPGEYVPGMRKRACDRTTHRVWPSEKKRELVHPLRAVRQGLQGGSGLERMDLADRGCPDAPYRG